MCCELSGATALVSDKGVIWNFLWGPSRVQVLQEQVSPGMTGRWSGHRAPCFCVQLSCDMMLAHGGLQEAKGPHVLESLWTHCECQLHQCPCSPREATSRCSHKLLPWGLSTECVHLLRLFLLLLLLSRFSRVRLCAIPEMAAHQDAPSLGFSRQEHWSGFHFLLQRLFLEIIKTTCCL